MSKVSLFGYHVDAIRMPDAVAQVLAWVAQANHNCRYVVTPNVDHTIMYQERPDLRSAYADASLVLADGFPVVVASRLVGKPLPERVAGSDLVYRLFDAFEARARQRTMAAARHAAERPVLVGAGVYEEHEEQSVDWYSELEQRQGLRVFLLGAAEGVGDRAATEIEARWPAVEVVGVYSPPLGFEKDAAENDAILRRIAQVEPDVLIVGLGAPKQELWVHTHRNRIEASVALCVGATIDFLAGEKPRAPVWMQRSGLEWLFRMASEPKRLVGRYARGAWQFPRLVYREWMAGRRGGYTNSYPS